MHVYLLKKCGYLFYFLISFLSILLTTLISFFFYIFCLFLLQSYVLVSLSPRAVPCRAHSAIYWCSERDCDSTNDLNTGLMHIQADLLKKNCLVSNPEEFKGSYVRGCKYPPSKKGMQKEHILLLV